MQVYMIEKAVPRKAIRIFMNISAPTSCKEKLITTDKLKTKYTHKLSQDMYIWIVGPLNFY